MLVPGSTLQQGRYQIVGPIKAGGMGAIYQANAIHLRCTVALKESLVSYDESLRRAFEREAHLLASLRHSVLPRVIDHFTESNGHFLVMDFIPGDDLAALLEKNDYRPFSVNLVLQWADQLLDALNYLHTRQPVVIHRDIKPQNIKLTEQGQIVLLDFGLAKGTPTQMSRATGDSSVQGYTPHYAPLEQITGKGTDPRSDLYSLAATFYHLLTGQPPPDAVLRSGEISTGGTDPLQPADEINPLVPRKLAALLLRTMAQKRDDRPQTASEMRQELKSFSFVKPAANSFHNAQTIVSSLLLAAPSFEAEKQQFPPNVPQQQPAPQSLSYETTPSNPQSTKDEESTLEPAPKPQPQSLSYETTPSNPPSIKDEESTLEPAPKPQSRQSFHTTVKQPTISEPVSPGRNPYIYVARQSGPKPIAPVSVTPAKPIRMWVRVLLLGISGLVVSLGGYVVKTGENNKIDKTYMGFDPSHVLSTEVAFSFKEYDKRSAYYQQALSRIEALPGVQRAGITSLRPSYGMAGPTGSVYTGTVGSGDVLHRATPVHYNVVGGHYFEALSIPVLRGRLFNDNPDADKDQPVIVISESLAKSLFSTEDPIGKRVTLLPSAPIDKWLVIVGVVRDVRRPSIDGGTPNEIYLPYGPNFNEDMALLVSTTGDPATLIDVVKKEIEAVNSSVATRETKILERQIAAQQSLYSFNTAFFPICSALSAGLCILSGYLIYSRRVRRATMI